MSRRISEFFYPDLLEEQHRWSIDQLAFFYQTTEEEVITALAKANDKFANDPLSSNYSNADSNSDGHFGEELSTRPCGDVPGSPGEDRVESSAGVAFGGCPP